VRPNDERSRGELYRALRQVIGDDNTDTLMSLLPDRDGPPTRDEIRHLESRVDARFKAVNARFSTIDRRFTSVVARIDEIEAQSATSGERLDDRLRAMEGRFDARFRSMEGRFDATDARIDLIQDRVVVQFDRTRRDLGRMLMVGIGVSTASTATLCMGTMALVI
jgi:hypothetical protein